MKTVDILGPDSARNLSGNSTIAEVFENLARVPDFPRVIEKPIARAASVRPQVTSRSLSLCLASSLRNRWVLYLGRREQFEKDPSAEAVHELRVASRRLMAQLDLFADVVSSHAAEKGHRILKRSMKPLGRLRDIQVQRIFVDEQLELFPELILFRDDLIKREHAREAAASEKVRALKIAKFEKWIALMLQDLAEKASDARQESRLSIELVRTLEKTYGSVTRRRRAITADNLETVHRTRIAFKKFRYVVESLSLDFTGFDERQLAGLAAYQRRMGVIQDLEVIHNSLSAFIKKYPAAEEFLSSFTRHLRQQRGRALNAFLQEADQLAEFVPALLKERANAV